MQNFQILMGGMNFRERSQKETQMSSAVRSVFVAFLEELKPRQIDSEIIRPLCLKLAIFWMNLSEIVYCGLPEKRIWQLTEAFLCSIHVHCTGHWGQLSHGLWPLNSPRLFYKQGSLLKGIYKKNSEERAYSLLNKFLSYVLFSVTDFL